MIDAQAAEKSHLVRAAHNRHRLFHPEHFLSQLAGDQIVLVSRGHGNDYIRLAGPGFIQHIGLCAVTMNNVQTVNGGQPAAVLGHGVYYRNGMALPN